MVRQRVDRLVGMLNRDNQALGCKAVQHCLRVSNPFARKGANVAKALASSSLSRRPRLT